MSRSSLRAAHLLSIVSLSAGAVGLAATSATAAPGKPAPSTVTQEGTLVQTVSDDFAHGRAGYAYGLRRADRTFTTVEGLNPGVLARHYGPDLVSVEVAADTGKLPDGTLSTPQR